MYDMLTIFYQSILCNLLGFMITSSVQGAFLLSLSVYAQESRTQKTFAKKILRKL